MPRFEGKKILVTGGTSGIGLATAKRLSEEGALVAVTGRQQAGLGQAKEEIPGCLAIANDAAEENAADDLARLLKAEWGALDGAFLNAGIGTVRPLEEVSPDEFDRQFHVNVRGPLLQAKSLKPCMSENGSVVLNTTAARKVGFPGMAIYAPTKGALRTLTRILAADFAPLGVRVNAVAPGAIATPFFQNGGLSQEEIEAFGNPILEKVPLGRWGTPEEVASVVLFLLSEDSSYVTGSEYVVDGGFSEV